MTPYDPLKPFIAQDGLEYDDLAACLLNQPQATARNRYIQEACAIGRSEKVIREWVKSYDGEDPRTTSELVAHRREARKKDADFSIYPNTLLVRRRIDTPS
jgi:hypothetical protein